jgi:hypothetical protein
MRRLPKTHKKLPMKKGDEPDFCTLDKSNPLPALEDAPFPGAADNGTSMQGQQQQLANPHSRHQGPPVPHSGIVTPPRPLDNGMSQPRGLHGTPHQGYSNVYLHPEMLSSQDDYDMPVPLHPRQPPYTGMSHPNMTSSSAYGPRGALPRMHGGPPVNSCPPMSDSPPARQPRSYRPPLSQMEQMHAESHGMHSEHGMRSENPQDDYYYHQQQQQMKHIQRMHMQQVYHHDRQMNGGGRGGPPLPVSQDEYDMNRRMAPRPARPHC